MSKFANGTFTPKNSQKYIGKGLPKYRSSWEFVAMQFFDNNPSVLQWASESINIPYRNPFTNKQTIYIPDFLIVYVDKTGAKHVELIEIKPVKETTMEAAKTKRDQAYAALNAAKWAAARAWCDQNGIRFRIITELDMFKQGRKR